jgi:hypothetical protein
VARMTNAHTVASDWGPLLVRAFPDGFASGQTLSENQRRFLRAIVDNDECWGIISIPTAGFAPWVCPPIGPNYVPSYRDFARQLAPAAITSSTSRALPAISACALSSASA